jgi:hypothetical protein
VSFLTVRDCCRYCCFAEENAPRCTYDYVICLTRRIALPAMYMEDEEATRPNIKHVWDLHTGQEPHTQVQMTEKLCDAATSQTSRP